MTQTQKRLWCVLVLPVLLLSGAGCNDDDDDVLNAPVDQAVETALNSALTTTVVPLVGFMAAVGDLLSSPLQGAVGGLACPDTSDWCSTGSVACTPTVNGLAFTFDQCEVATGDLPLTLDGNVTAVPGSTVGLTLTSLFINDSPAISGTGSIDTSACDYVVNMQTSEATVSGTVTQCDSDEFPTGEALLIGFGDFLVTVTFNGSSVAPATATQAGTPVASCSINLAASPLTSTCDAL
jgi:hypothetical protein